jgi:hypothetical protein
MLCGLQRSERDCYRRRPPRRSRHPRVLTPCSGRTRHHHERQRYVPACRYPLRRRRIGLMRLPRHSSSPLAAASRACARLSNSSAYARRRGAASSFSKVRASWRTRAARARSSAADWASDGGTAAPMIWSGGVPALPPLTVLTHRDQRSRHAAPSCGRRPNTSAKLRNP